MSRSSGLPKKNLIDERQQEVHGIIDGAPVLLLLVLVVFDQLVETSQGSGPARRVRGLEEDANLVDDLWPLVREVLLDDHRNANRKLNANNFRGLFEKIWDI